MLVHYITAGLLGLWCNRRNHSLWFKRRVTFFGVRIWENQNSSIIRNCTRVFLLDLHSTTLSSFLVPVCEVSTLSIVEWIKPIVFKVLSELSHQNPRYNYYDPSSDHQTYVPSSINIISPSHYNYQPTDHQNAGDTYCYPRIYLCNCPDIGQKSSNLIENYIHPSSSICNTILSLPHHDYYVFRK